MRRETLPLETLATWAKLNGVSFNRVEVAPLPGSRGSGLVVTSQRNIEDSTLVKVPKDLVLSLENVWIYAKSDKHLKDVIKAVGEYARVIYIVPSLEILSCKALTNACQTARGAILIFLLLQITNGRSEGRIGVANPLTEYVKLLPSRFPLPTFWDDEERAWLVGTSIEAALEAKLKSLDREFTLLRESTSSIGWCQQHWWNTETGALKFDDWKQVDAMYRSRALDLPGTGHAMVPCIDMANHASGDDTVALYETDDNGDAVLLLQDTRSIVPGEEITITYGDEKGACEMLFSYGFIEDNMKNAQELFLDLKIPDDDPLKIAKKAVNKSAPGFRLFLRENAIRWEGPFTWLLCVNEEDGLGFRILQTNDGESELKVNWKDSEIANVAELDAILKAEPLWDVFELRAIATLQTRLKSQLLAFESSKGPLQGILSEQEDTNPKLLNALRLGDLEETLMLLAYEEFENRVSYFRPSFHE